MSLQPRTAAPGKARRAASAGKPRTKKNAAPKATAPKTTRRYSDGPKGTLTRKEERNLERSKLRAKRYQEKIAPKAKTTSRADEFVAKRNSDTRPNFVPQKRTKWIPGQKPRKQSFKPRTHTREAIDFGANDNYIVDPTPTTSTLSNTNATWAQLGLSAPLINALSAQGITAPFPIQVATLPDALKGHDILGRGQTGSGKTLAFGLALLNNLQNKQAKPHKPLALVLTPTRELAQQIDEVLTPLARAIGHESVVIAGGMPYAKQITAMRKAVAILVATPGRLIDLLNRGEVQLDNLEITVLDEADQMADMGFLPVVKEILDQGKMGGQRLLFSATLDRGVDSLVKSYLKNPKTHSLQNDRASVSTIDHHVLVMHPGDKDLITAQIAARNGKTILFVKTQRGADRLADNLAKAGVPVGALHGGKSQAVRTRTLKLFNHRLPIERKAEA